MGKNYKEMKKVIEEIKEGDLFLVTITRQDKKRNNLKTSFFMENFYRGDLEETKEVINNLINDAQEK